MTILLNKHERINISLKQFKVKEQLRRALRPLTSSSLARSTSWLLWRELWVLLWLMICFSMESESSPHGAVSIMRYKVQNHSLLPFKILLTAADNYDIKINLRCREITSFIL